MKLKIVLMGLMMAGAISMMKVSADEAAPSAEPAAVTATAEAPKEITALDQFVIFWNQGGLTMYFIALLSILGIGCAQQVPYSAGRFHRRGDLALEGRQDR